MTLWRQDASRSGPVSRREGVPSAVILAAVAQKLPALGADARVLTYCYDTGERYLPVDGLFEMLA